MLPTLSRLSVSCEPGSRLRYWCSSQYLRISPLHWEFRYPLSNSSLAVSNDHPRLSRDLLHLTYQTAYTPFTPSNSGQRLLPPYYRGCWHGVSRSLLCGYRQSYNLFELYNFRPHLQGFTLHRTSSPTRRCCVRLSPIAQYSSLLPPVGVWAVSQSQCG